MDDTGHPLISVIVPVFDVEDHVGACIASLRAQTLTDFEAIVVDDGSTDGSRAAALAAIGDDPRFRLVARANGGLSAARNTGLDLARGAFVAFLDSDDRVEPDWLSAMHAALEADGGDWVATAIRYADPDGRTVVHPAIHGRPMPEGEAPRRFPLEAWTDAIPHFPSAWNKLYRRGLIGDIRFDEGTYYEDHAFFWQLAARTGHLLWLPRPLYRQTQGRAGQITRDGGERVFDQIAVLDRLAEIAAASDRPGADAALARIATRLTWERSLAIADPDRRARFAAAAQGWLGASGLAPDAAWDPAIPRAWAVMLGGTLPLSVVLVVPQAGSGAAADRAADLAADRADDPARAAAADRKPDPAACPGTDPASNPLVESLAALAAGGFLDLEVIVAPETPEAAADLAAAAAAAAAWARAPLPPLRCADPPAGGKDGAGNGAAARARGLALARGRLAACLVAGERPAPGMLASWVETMLRSGAALGLAGPRPAGIPVPPATFPAPPDAAATARMLDRAPVTAERTAEAAAEGTAAAMVRAVWLGDAPAGSRAGLRAGLRAEVGAAGPPDAAGSGNPGAWLPAAADAPWTAPAKASIRPPAPLLNAPVPHAPVPHIPVQPAHRTPRAGRIETETPMLSFRTRGGATLAYPVDFTVYDYANISFFDATRSTILFHLSLRQGPGLAVTNRRGPAGWEAERAHPVTLEPEGNRVEIRFAAAGGVEVLVNDAPVCAYGSEYDRLDRIVSFDFHGGIPETGFAMTGAANSGRVGRGDLRLSPGLMLEGWAFDPEGAPDQRADLEVEGLDPDEALAVAALPRPDLAPRLGPLAATARPGLAVPLPGRVWRACGAGDGAAEGSLAADAALVIQPRVGGVPCGAPLTVTRALVIERIEALAARPEAERETSALLLAIEHARFARLFPALSGGAQAMLRAAAATFGVTAFLFPAAATAGTVGQAAPPALSAPRQRREDALLAAARERFAETMRAAPGTDPLTLLAEPLPPAARRAFHLGLAEFFCARDAFPALFARHREDRQPPMRPAGPNDRWHNSAVLPFLYLQGDIEALRATFWGLSKTREGWLCTAAAGWVVRDMLRGPAVPMDGKAQDDLVRAFMALVTAEAADPAGRAPCAELIRATVALTAAAGRLVDHLARDVEAFALRAYGLSRAFWHSLDAAVPASGLTPRLAAARAAFATVEGALDPGAEPAAVAAALQVFAALGCADAGRFRLDLFGPAGLPLPEGALPDPATLIAAGLDPEEAVLRSLAAPGAPAGDPAHVTLARAAIAARYAESGLPAAPLAALREAAVARARTILAGDGSGAPDPAVLETLLADIARLGAARGEFAGQGLALRLIAGLLRRGGRNGPSAGDIAAAEAVLARLAAATAALPEAEAEALARAPAVVSALVGLLAAEAALPPGSPAARIAAAALAMVPEALAEAEALPRPAPPATPTDLPAVAALFDTIVVVMSCRPYLDSRIPALRSGWLGTLADLGVPYLVAVGGAEPDAAGRVDGDILHLDAPDDYEGLPQKTLAMVRWVLRNTPHAHVLKIDDDCFLDAGAFFGSHAFAAFDYHGRRIDRGIGNTDRLWHMAKSTSARGRFELDRSPEPSAYCDGGSGYTLSRRAMAALVAAADAPENRALVAASFMEDKLVGDLLATRGILPAAQDHRVTVLRRTHREAVPVPVWLNGFLPSAAASVHVAHLDSAALQPRAAAQRAAATLWPRKIWPTHQRTRLGHNTNALDLLTEEAALARLARAPVAVVAVVRNERAMLPLFLAHYRAMGVEAFLIADNLSDDGSREFLMGEPDVAVFSVDTEYRQSQYGVAWQQAILAHYRTGRWTLVADADEFLVADLDRRTRLPDLVAGPAFAGAEAARIFMLDMYPEGPLASATFASGDPFAEAGFVDAVPFRTASLGRGPYSDAPTWTSALRHRLIPGSRAELFVAQKIALLRYAPWMRLSAGLHYVADARLARRDLIFAHFKYNAAFRARAEAEVARRQHFNDAEEYRKYLALAAEGRETVFDPAVSVPWTDCATVQRILGD
jgi:hypothetical protein